MKKPVKVKLWFSFLSFFYHCSLERVCQPGQQVESVCFQARCTWRWWQSRFLMGEEKKNTSTRVKPLCVKACKRAAHKQTNFSGSLFLCSLLKKNTSVFPHLQLVLAELWQKNINLHLFAAAKTVTAPLGRLINAPNTHQGGLEFISRQITQETREAARAGRVASAERLHETPAAAADTILYGVNSYWD